MSPLTGTDPSAVSMGGNPNMGLIADGKEITHLRAERMKDGRVHIFRASKKFPEMKGTGLILEPENILSLVNDLLAARAEHLDATPRSDTSAP